MTNPAFSLLRENFVYSKIDKSFLANTNTKCDSACASAYMYLYGFWLELCFIRSILFYKVYFSYIVMTQILPFWGYSDNLT